LWNEDLAGLEKNASEATSRYRAARSALAAFKKLRDSGALADPASVRAMYEQKQREHHAATERWQQADAALKTAIGEGGRLVALHKAAELERRRTAKQVVAAHGRLNGATAEHARTEGRLAELLKPPGAGLHVLRAAAPGAGAGPVPAMRAAARGRGRPA
jgi:hypothetical protein